MSLLEELTAASSVEVMDNVHASLKLSDWSIKMTCSGGSRISDRGCVDLRCGHFSMKMYAKTKELGPIGGHVPGMLPPPPRSTNDMLSIIPNLVQQCKNLSYSVFCLVIIIFYLFFLSKLV